MYFITEPDAPTVTLGERLRAATADFLSQFTPTPLVVPSNTDPFSCKELTNGIGVITDGRFTGQLHERTVAMFEEGDIIGIERIGTNASASIAPRLALHSEFGVRVDAYPLTEIHGRIGANPVLARAWNELIGLTISCYQYGLASLAQVGSDPTPAIRQYQAGDIIIHEGHSTTEIFTLLEGHADVTINHQRVGEVLPDEIFGALAAFSGSPRSATVTATKPCVVLVLESDKFLSLLSSHPVTVVKLVKDMARALSSANTALISRI